MAGEESGNLYKKIVGPSMITYAFWYFARLTLAKMIGHNSNIHWIFIRDCSIFISYCFFELPGLLFQGCHCLCIVPKTIIQVRTISLVRGGHWGAGWSIIFGLRAILFFRAEGLKHNNKIRLSGRDIFYGRNLLGTIKLLGLMHLGSLLENLFKIYT